MVLQRQQRVAVWGTHVLPGASISVRFRDQEIHTNVDEKGRWRVHLEPMAATKLSPLKAHVGETLRVKSGSSTLKVQIGRKETTCLMDRALAQLHIESDVHALLLSASDFITRCCGNGLRARGLVYQTPKWVDSIAFQVRDILVGDVFIASGQSNMDKGGIQHTGVFPLEEKKKHSNFSFEFPNVRWMRLRGLPEYSSMSFPPGSGGSHGHRLQLWFNMKRVL